MSRNRKKANREMKKFSRIKSSSVTLESITKKFEAIRIILSLEPLPSGSSLARHVSDLQEKCSPNKPGRAILSEKMTSISSAVLSATRSIVSPVPSEVIISVEDLLFSTAIKGIANPSRKVDKQHWAPHTFISNFSAPGGHIKNTPRNQLVLDAVIFDSETSYCRQTVDSSWFINNTKSSGRAKYSPQLEAMYSHIEEIYSMALQRRLRVKTKSRSNNINSSMFAFYIMMNVRTPSRKPVDTISKFLTEASLVIDKYRNGAFIHILPAGMDIPFSTELPSFSISKEENSSVEAFPLTPRLLAVISNSPLDKRSARSLVSISRQAIIDEAIESGAELYLYKGWEPDPKKRDRKKREYLIDERP